MEKNDVKAFATKPGITAAGMEPAARSTDAPTKKRVQKWERSGTLCTRIFCKQTCEDYR